MQEARTRTVFAYIPQVIVRRDVAGNLRESAEMAELDFETSEMGE